MQRPFFKSSRLLSSAALFAAFAAFSTSSSALQPLITDDTGTQGEGGNQLEVSYGRDRIRAGGETARVHSVPVVYTYGLTETVDVYAGIAYQRIRVPEEIILYADPAPLLQRAVVAGCSSSGRFGVPVSERELASARALLTASPRKARPWIGTPRLFSASPAVFT